MSDQQSEQGTEQLIAWMRHEAALRRHERDHTSENLEAAADRLEALEALVKSLGGTIDDARIELSHAVCECQGKVKCSACTAEAEIEDAWLMLVEQGYFP